MSAGRFRIPASKSELIRALVLQSFEPSLVISGESACDDVVRVQTALEGLESGQKRLHLGDSGLGLRCLAFRVSRCASEGSVLLTGSQRLLSRPHDELWQGLRELGCSIELEGGETPGVRITPPEGGEWTVDSLQISGARSSQFASAVLLSSLGLSRDFVLTIEGPIRSRGYLDLTLNVLRRVGVRFAETRSGEGIVIRVPAASRPQAGSPLLCEGDWSTAAGLLAVAAVHRCGELTRFELEGLSRESLQPDRAILGWLEAMGVSTRWQDDLLILENPGDPQKRRLRGVSVSAEACPDLVPVFSALAALAAGRSEVHGAPQLRHKESDRIRRGVLLARLLGANAAETSDGFWVEPGEEVPAGRLPQVGGWSVDRDHRQVMAAFVALAAGARFSVDEISAVSKSAPEFLEWMNRLKVTSRPPALLFLGHRGTGKTALARRLSARLGCEAIDLDDEIEKACGQRITEIFSTRGEEAFRVLEREKLTHWLSLEVPPCGRIIVAGAGVDPALPPAEWRELLARQGFEAIWISRATDAQGRIFLDRPRLDAALSPLDEFRRRAISRDSLYRSLASRRVILQEGADRHPRASSGEAALLVGIPDVVTASITIPARILLDPARLRQWIERRRGWAFHLFEVRDDLLPEGLTEGQALTLLREFARIPGQNLLFSRRLADPSAALGLVESVLRSRGARLDWALELGAPPLTRFRPGDILSSHEGIPTADGLPGGVVLKWSPRVVDWKSLRIGHEWMLQAPGRRTFQPRSDTGKWRHYRLWLGRRHQPPLHFVREDEGTALDQPTLIEWIENPRVSEEFGAVLGSPIFHSRSPERHGPNFFAFEVARDEWNDALEFLLGIGLRRAAVTAPLKEVAFEWVSRMSGEMAIRHPSPERTPMATRLVTLSFRARRLRSVNTLQWSARGGRWEVRADNTDLPGFERVLAMVARVEAIDWPTVRVVLWGGGGTAAMVRELLPQVVEYSARTGTPREGQSPGESLEGNPPREGLGPDVLIWGVGRSVFNGIFPPDSWRPRLILDLNYTEDSPGLEYAQGLPHARYVSGLSLFEAQADEQWGERYPVPKADGTSYT